MSRTGKSPVLKLDTTPLIAAGTSSQVTTFSNGPMKASESWEVLKLVFLAGSGSCVVQSGGDTIDSFLVGKNNAERVSYLVGPGSGLIFTTTSPVPKALQVEIWGFRITGEE